MDDPTCSVDGCDKKLRARGMCSAHYARWHTENPDKIRPRRKNSPGATCSVEGCDNPRNAQALCSTHYGRMLKNGNTDAQRCETCHASTPAPNMRFCSDACKPRCTVDGCDDPQRKRGWCVSHYAQWRRVGEVKPFGYKWADAGGACPVCGSETGKVRGFRKHCSANCAQLVRTHKGNVPVKVDCVRCGVVIPLATGGGRRRSSLLTMCDRCRNESRKHAMTTAELAARDGTDCSICGEPVDMMVRRPDLFCASVDHVIPRALGGKDVPENYALAHLWCNQIKNRRAGFSLKKVLG